MRQLVAVLTVALALGAGGCGASTTSDNTAGPAAGVTSTGRPFCEVLRDVNALYRSEVSLNIDSSMSSGEGQQRMRSFLDELRGTLDRGDSLLRELNATAPEEIASPVGLVVEDGLRRSQSMRRAGEDPMALIGGWWPNAQSAALLAAAGDIDVYAIAACGFAFRPDGR